MSRIYCELSDVKRLLRSVSNKENKIRFSDAYRDLKADSGNSGTIALSGVCFVDSFADNETYTFSFTDSTSFDVSGNVIGNLGSGNTQAEFTASGRFTVPVANWSGAAVSGDKYYITSASNMSDDDGHAFIVDVTKYINSKLERVYGDLANVSFYDSTSVDIPDALSYACSRFAAYEIFNSIFACMSPPGEESIVEMWKTAADEKLEEYSSGHGTGPLWKSRESLITEVGVEGVGEGVLDIDEIPDAKNKQYER